MLAVVAVRHQKMRDDSDLIFALLDALEENGLVFARLHRHIAHVRRGKNELGHRSLAPNQLHQPGFSVQLGYHPVEIFVIEEDGVGGTRAEDAVRMVDKPIPEGFETDCVQELSEGRSGFHGDLAREAVPHRDGPRHGQPDAAPARWAARSALTAGLFAWAAAALLPGCGAQLAGRSSDDGSPMALLSKRLPQKPVTLPANAEVFASGQGQITHVASNGERVAWYDAASRTLRYRERMGGEVHDLQADVPELAALLADDRGVYWATRATAQTDAAIAALAWGSDEVDNLARATGRVGGLTLYEGTLYWTQSRRTPAAARADGSIASMGLNDELPKIVLSGLVEPGALSVAKDGIYWISAGASWKDGANGGLYRLGHGASIKETLAGSLEEPTSLALVDGFALVVVRGVARKGRPAGILRVGRADGAVEALLVSPRTIGALFPLKEAACWTSPGETRGVDSTITCMRPSPFEKPAYVVPKRPAIISPSADELYVIYADPAEGVVLRVKHPEVPKAR